MSAWADAFIPFWDPYKEFYEDECGDVPGMYKVSRFFGHVSRDALLIAAIPNIGTWAKNPVMYEIGQKTLPRGVYQGLQGLSVIEAW